MLRLLPLLALLGCPTTKDGEVSCDMMAVTSVMVNVRSESGESLVHPFVEFSVDDGVTFEPCSDNGDGQWSCGWEQAGAITIQAGADGYATSVYEVTVEEDVCHVITETVEAVLTPMVDCTDVELPSVVVTVVGSGGEELSGVGVVWAHPDTRVVEACEPAGGETWNCGYEVAGEINVSASADGHATEAVAVEVTADECHVITESVEIALDWLPD